MRSSARDGFEDDDIPVAGAFEIRIVGWPHCCECWHHSCELATGRPPCVVSLTLPVDVDEDVTGRERVQRPC